MCSPLHPVCTAACGIMWSPPVLRAIKGECSHSFHTAHWGKWHTVPLSLVYCGAKSIQNFCVSTLLTLQLALSCHIPPITSSPTTLALLMGLVKNNAMKKEKKQKITSFCLYQPPRIARLNPPTAQAKCPSASKHSNGRHSLNSLVFHVSSQQWLPVCTFRHNYTTETVQNVV